jgi:septal ring factor EnvC (AmiA/AmiB activator)
MAANLETFAEREVKKASRELNNQTSKLDDIQKIEALQKRCADLFAEMKRLERDNLKNKKRGDQLQKEKDHSRTELSKNVSLREKLEKLCRELQKENNRLKVYCTHVLASVGQRFANMMLMYFNRVRTRLFKMPKSETMRIGMRSMRTCSGSYKTIKRTKIIHKRRWSTLK